MANSEEIGQILSGIFQWRTSSFKFRNCQNSGQNRTEYMIAQPDNISSTRLS